MKTTTTLTHFLAALIITGILFTVYACVQQTYRKAADDPQTQIARDISSRLNRNLAVDHLLPADTIEITEDEGIFVQLYNSDRQLVMSTAQLNKKEPQLPKGVFDNADKNGEAALSWEPQKGIREATIVVPVLSPQVAYVVAGRSLKETEIRESNLEKMIFISFAISIGIVLIHWLIVIFSSKKKPVV
jgi:hypothetical protein